MSKKNGTAKVEAVKPIEEKLPDPATEDIEESQELEIEIEKPSKKPWWKNWKVLAGAGAAIAAIGGIALLGRTHKSDEEYADDLNEYCESDTDDEEEKSEDSDET